jgi:hypothetical protein
LQAVSALADRVFRLRFPATGRLQTAPFFTESGSKRAASLPKGHSLRHHANTLFHGLNFVPVQSRFPEAQPQLSAPCLALKRNHGTKHASLQHLRCSAKLA